MIDTTTDIKKALEFILSDFLGTYTYPNGFTRKAVCIGNTPGEIKVAGLEVVLPVFGNVNESVMLITAGTYVNQKVRVVLIQRDNNLGNLASAVKLLYRSRVFLIDNGSNFTQQDATRTYNGYTFNLCLQGIE